MIVRRVLRATAIAIALAALIDPVFTREQISTAPLTVVAVGDGAVSQASRVRDALSNVRATMQLHDPAAAAAACPSEGDCVIVSAGHVPFPVSAGSRVVGVVDARRAELDTETAVLQRIDVQSPVHRDVAGSVRVHLARPATRVDVFDGDVLVGSAEPGGKNIVDVPWVPVATGARALRIVAEGQTAHAGVVVEGAPRPVLFYELQASWLGTFVRRALEDDTRFEVRGRTRIAPPVAITHGESGALNAAALEAVGTVIVSAPEMLSTAEVDLLEQFVGRRGGSLIVLPDQRPSGASLRLLPRVVAERRDPQPRDVGALRATEWLTFDPAVGVLTLAAVDEQPVIVSRAFGRGRVVVSGALDAWRYRQASDGFGRFWTSLAWDAARLAGAPLRVDTDRVIARPGEVVTINAEVVTMAAPSVTSAAASPDAAAAVSCGADRSFVRLWPGARPGAFIGAFRIDHEGECVVAVNIDGVSGTTPVTFRDDLQTLAAEDQQLRAVAAAHGAMFVAEPNVDDLVAHVGAQLATRRETVPTHPMRSPWWVVPFAFCLGGEWWLRRKSGIS